MKEGGREEGPGETGGGSGGEGTSGPDFPNLVPGWHSATTRHLAL